jgi:hypothetical protein
MGGEGDLVDFNDAPGGGAGRALDGDNSLIGVHAQELSLIVVGRADAGGFGIGVRGVAEVGQPGIDAPRAGTRASAGAR